MTSIWDEKPGFFDRYERYSVVGQCYDKEKMDVWLEKLKLQWDILKTSVEVYHGIPDPVVIPNDKYIKLKEKAEKLGILRRLVEDWLPQIGMTIHFREMFYQIVGEPHPDWFEVRELGFYEQQWLEEVRGLATRRANNES